jgi:hypothetical protein
MASIMRGNVIDRTAAHPKQVATAHAIPTSAHRGLASIQPDYLKKGDEHDHTSPTTMG